MNENKKTFWLINQYGSTPTSGYGGRLFYLSKELVKRGHTVFLVIGHDHHLLNYKGELPESEVFDGINIFRVKTLKYRGAHSFKRVLSWFVFAFKILFLNLRLKSKPDIIISSSPSPFIGVAGMVLAKIHRAKCIFDIRDIWPLTLTTLGGVSERHPLIWLMSRAEKFSFKYSDIISSNLPNVSLRIKEVLDIDKEFIWLPNGYDEFEVSRPDVLSIDVCNKIPSSSFIVGYVGTLGLANALEPLFEAAARIKNNKNISIVIVGNGELEGKFKKIIEERGLVNVHIFNRIAKSQVQSLIKIFDVCYIGWRNEPLYKYGVAPNKIPEYFYSGKPVLHSYSGALDPVALAEAGVSVAAESTDDIASAIIELSKMSHSSLEVMGNNGKRYAEQYYNYSLVAEKLIEVTCRD
jgi:glycosyltransferase involved in cell wall biosynthesis